VFVDRAFDLQRARADVIADLVPPRSGSASGAIGSLWKSPRRSQLIRKRHRAEKRILHRR
jgi:hypothetical protein